MKLLKIPETVSYTSIIPGNETESIVVLCSSHDDFDTVQDYLIHNGYSFILFGDGIIITRETYMDLFTDLIK